ncbi:DUF2835 domain-containing protein [Pseudoteredinibacter isoporae]|uniref:DUF2835 domain-containing protein n=1 Tax=Pseudoteredinibacter isoporae TaxID=570281 RepID=UPI00333EB7C4
MSKHFIVVDLSISPEEYQKLYRFAIKDVHARSRDGRSVRFPVNVLRRFVGHNGVQGAFRIGFDHNHRLSSFERLS